VQVIAGQLEDKIPEDKTGGEWIIHNPFIFIIHKLIVE